MKKILLISQNFYPYNIMGAIRPTKLAEFLSQKGYDVDIIAQDFCTDASLNADTSKMGRIIRLSCSKISSETEQLLLQKPISARSNTAKKKLFGLGIPHWAKNLKRFFLSNKKAKIFHKNFINLIKNNQIDISKYDVLITSYGPLGALLCGFSVKKMKPNIKWICDFRDPLVTSTVPTLGKIKYRKLELRACKMADVITVVSNGYNQRICGDKYKDKSVVIPNGFDIKDIPNDQNNKKGDKFTFTYVGLLYDGKRDISNLFAAIRELSDEGKVNIDNIVFEYAGMGNEIKILNRQAAKYSLENIIHNNGLIKREDCLALQMRSDVLVLATWNTKAEIGVFPGKMIEYMLFNKPIVSLVSGDIENCEITEAINRLKIGFSYEEISGESQFAEFKEYICSLINGTLNFCPDNEKIMQYEWNNIVKKFEEAING